MRPATLPYLCTCGKPRAGHARPYISARHSFIFDPEGDAALMLPNQTISAILSSLRTFEPLSDTLDIIIISFVFTSFCNLRANPARASWSGASCLSSSYGLSCDAQPENGDLAAEQRAHHRFYGGGRYLPAGTAPHAGTHGPKVPWPNRLFGTHRRDPSLRAVGRAPSSLSATQPSSCPTPARVPWLVLERNNNLDEIIRTGTPMHADVIPEMLGTIFYEGTPCDDGAVVIRDGVIVAASTACCRCPTTWKWARTTWAPATARRPWHERKFRRHCRHRQRGNGNHLHGEERCADPPPGSPEPPSICCRRRSSPRRRTRPKTLRPAKLLRKGRTEPWKIRINPACRGQKAQRPKVRARFGTTRFYNGALAIIPGLCYLDDRYRFY